ncbi:MAG TPA: GNAT family N-acetyltransferase [Lysobacter sp.]|nr:GNAT family N-acetyltransferase [Lysobacter sp.]
MTPLTESEPRHAGHPAQRALVVRSVVGEAIGPFLGDIAQLRATVLREWPTLQDSDAASQARDLQVYLESWRSIAILVSDGDRLVGASIGLPLGDADEPLRRAFTAAGREVDRVFHFGGSMLLPAYRGRGLGHRFFDERESHARALGGFELTTFRTVERAADDPRRPPFGHSFKPFLLKRGYRRCGELAVATAWHEVHSGGGQTPQKLATRSRPLERSF